MPPGTESAVGSWLVGPLVGQQPASVAQQLRDDLGVPDDGDEVGVADPAWDDVHVQVFGQRTARRRPQVQADVEAVRARHRLHDADRLLHERHQLRTLGFGELLQFREAPVRHHHQMPGVVRVQVEHRVDVLAAGHHQAFLVGQRGDVGERLRRSLGSRSVVLDRGLGQVCHPVRRPKPFQTVDIPDTPVGDSRRPLALLLAGIPADHVSPPALTVSAVATVLLRWVIQSTMVATASSRGTPLIWDRSPNRKLTAPAATSRSPASSMNGTFWLVWLTIFLGIRSSLASTSTRTPCDLSCAATSSRYGTCWSATGMPTTCTGASQAGNAPA